MLCLNMVCLTVAIARTGTTRSWRGLLTVALPDSRMSNILKSQNGAPSPEDKGRFSQRKRPKYETFLNVIFLNGNNLYSLNSTGSNVD